MVSNDWQNLFRPCAGYPPLFLAGREAERQVFLNLSWQMSVVDNLILTGPRGVGKTVLLDSFKTNASAAGWLWVGNDVSDASSFADADMCTRVLTDLAVGRSGVAIVECPSNSAGLVGAVAETHDGLIYDKLQKVFVRTPGLAEDNLKAVLEFAWEKVASRGVNGIIFAYDEAQNLGVDATADQHPVELLLGVCYSLQRKGVPLLLVLAGLPTLFPRLDEARTYAERMFRVVSLGRLSLDGGVGEVESL